MSTAPIPKPGPDAVPPIDEPAYLEEIDALAGAQDPERLAEAAEGLGSLLDRLDAELGEQPRS